MKRQNVLLGGAGVGVALLITAGCSSAPETPPASTAAAVSHTGECSGHAPDIRFTSPDKGSEIHGMSGGQAILQVCKIAAGKDIWLVDSDNGDSSWHRTANPVTASLGELTINFPVLGDVTDIDAPDTMGVIMASQDCSKELASDFWNAEGVNPAISLPKDCTIAASVDVTVRWPVLAP